MAYQSLLGVKFRMLTIYPRRPKVSHIHSEQILLRVNGLLFDRAKTSRTLGVPVLAAIPLVSSLTNYTRAANCLFIELAETGEETDVMIDIVNPIISNPNLSILPERELASFVNLNCAIIQGDQAILIMNELRKGFGGMWSMAQDLYKPIYLLIPESVINE